MKNFIKKINNKIMEEKCLAIEEGYDFRQYLWFPEMSDDELEVFFESHDNKTLDPLAYPGTVIDINRFKGFASYKELLKIFQSISSREKYR